MAGLLIAIAVLSFLTLAGVVWALVRLNRLPAVWKETGGARQDLAWLKAHAEQVVHRLAAALERLDVMLRHGEVIQRVDRNVTDVQGVIRVDWKLIAERLGELGNEVAALKRKLDALPVGMEPRQAPLPALPPETPLEKPPRLRLNDTDAETALRLAEATGSVKVQYVDAIGLFRPYNLGPSLVCPDGEGHVLIPATARLDSVQEFNDSFSMAYACRGEIRRGLIYIHRPARVKVVEPKYQVVETGEIEIRS